jgi:hypothetical protein
LFGQQFAEIFQRLNRTSLQLLEFINNQDFKNEKDWRDALADFKRSVMPPPRAQFQRESLTSALNAASALLVIGRWIPSLHALLYPVHPALLGTIPGRLQLLRCSCPLSALLLRLVSVIDHSGRTMAQHDRHELMARIMKRYFSAVAHRLWPWRSMTGTSSWPAS